MRRPAARKRDRFGDAREPAPLLGVVLRRALGATPLARPLSGWSTVERWAEIVGPRVAARSQAVEWRDGQLLVEVFGAVWMAELTLQKRTLIAHIQQVTGNEAVTSLHFVPASQAPGAPRDTAAAPPPRTSNTSTTGRRAAAGPRKNPKGV